MTDLWVRNPRGFQTEVHEDRIPDLLSKGYRLLSPDEIIANRRLVEVDARIAQEHYPYGGYGRVGELLNEFVKWNPNSNTVVYLGYPRPFEREEGQKVILISAWEATPIPPQWKEHLDKYDLVLVPSKFCQRIFKDGGTKALVKVMIQGTDNFNITKTPNGPFTYLHYNSFGDYGRKGWDLVIKAYTELFSPRDQYVKLILKGREHDLGDDLDRVPKRKNIEVIVKNYKRYEIEELQERAHCFVFPSRGEGVGLPPIEHLSRAIPTIFTDAFGMTEYSEFGNKIGVRGFTPAVYDFPYEGEWIEPDFDEIKQTMFRVYKYYNEQKKKAEREQPAVKKKFSGIAMARKFRTLLNKYISYG